MRKLAAGTTLGLLLLSATMFMVVRKSTMATIGGLLIVAGSAVVLTMVWWRQLTVARLAFAAPSTGFAREAAEKLRWFERSRPAHYCAVLLGPLAGMNLVLAAFLPRQWVTNAIGSGLIVAELWYASRVAKERFRRDTLPLVERLESFEQAARD
jgi:hypothetical protein